jgi:hypothetical protein
MKRTANIIWNREKREEFPLMLGTTTTKKGAHSTVHFNTALKISARAIRQEKGINTD